MAHCGWYKRAMGMQRARQRATVSISAAQGRGLNSVLGLAVLGLIPALAACSSFSSSSTPTASAPTYQPASAVATTGATSASDATNLTTPYPRKSLMEVFTEDAQEEAAKKASSASAPPTTTYASQQPGMPHPPSTYTASAPPYQGTQPGYDAYVGPGGAPAKPAPVAAQQEEPIEVPGYASKSLIDVFTK
jgi:hypothetical protein